MNCYFCQEKTSKFCGLKESKYDYETDFDIKIKVCKKCEELFLNYSICDNCKFYKKLPFNRRTKRFTIVQKEDDPQKIFTICNCSN